MFQRLTLILALVALPAVAEPEAPPTQEAQAQTAPVETAPVATDAVPTAGPIDQPMSDSPSAIPRWWGGKIW